MTICKHGLPSWVSPPCETCTSLADVGYGHSSDCALNCDHCHHGRDCWRYCCWCSGVRDGEGNVSMEFVECDCEES